jgi:hypothetical protein
MAEEMKPPMHAPITPSTMVSKQPSFCFPGTNARAIRPMINPDMTQLSKDSMEAPESRFGAQIMLQRH